MDYSLSDFVTNLPAELDFVSIVRFVLIFAAASVALGLIGRIIFGKHSNLNHAVSSAMGIILIYVAAMIIHTFIPGNLSHFLTPLPFVEFSGEHLYILSLRNAGIQVICENLLSVLILSFLVNTLDKLIPKGKTIIRWFLNRLLSVTIAMVLYYLVDSLSRAFLPGVLVAYAPIVLVGILILFFALGVLNVLLGVVLAVVHPILGSIYAFFFSNKLGKQFSKAILTAALVTAIVCVLEHFGYNIISIHSAALLSYFPFLLALLLLWYLTGNLL